MRRMSVSLSAVAAACLAAAAGPVLSTGGDARAQDAAPSDPTVGPMAGTFELNGAASLSVGFDDNVYATRNDRVADGLLVLGWEASAEQDLADRDLRIYASGAHGRYFSESDENYDDVALGTEIGRQVTPAWRLFGGLSFARAHESRESPDAVNGVEPTTYSDIQAFAGSSTKIGRGDLRIGATYSRLDFDDVSAAGGAPIDNDDRDRQEVTFGGRGGYDLGGGYEMFAQALADLRIYDDGADDNGFDRDSQGYGVGFGVRYDNRRNLELEALLGYLHQTYDDPLLENIGALDIGLSGTWRPTGRTRIRGGIARSIEETTINGASGYVLTSYTLGLEQAVHPQVSLDTSVGFYTNRFVGIARDDHVLGLSAGARYFPMKHIFVGTSYEYLQRDSSDPNEDYDENRVFLRVGAQLAPGYDPAFDYGEVPAFVPGTYAGVQAGYGNLGTELEGQRGGAGGGVPGSLTADFGDHGPEAGIFAGWGVDVGNWYLGLEADASHSMADWDHANLPGERIFGVERGTSVGFGPRFGYRLDGGNLVYGRFGLALTEFGTDYAAPDGAGGYNTASEDHWLPGLRFGLGTEAPVGGGGGFVRLDYSYTAYRDYDVQWLTPTGQPRRDNFANDESLMRLGFGWRLGETRDAPARPASSFDGAYGGVLAGHGALNSVERGARSGGATTLTADRGDTGVAGGFFGGYGKTFGNVYVGVDASVELADVTRDNERDPSGRTISTDRRGSAGAGVRVGYTPDGNALFYLRLGGTASVVDTGYEAGGTVYDQTDTLTGVSVGGGIEIPASDNAFVRMDYTYTDYGSYRLPQSGGNVDSFDTDESMFRVGIGFRF